MSADSQWIKCRCMLYQWPGSLLQTSLLWEVGRGSSQGIFYMCWWRRIHVRKQMTGGLWLNPWAQAPLPGELLVGYFCNKKGSENNGFIRQWVIVYIMKCTQRTLWCYYLFIWMYVSHLMMHICPRCYQILCETEEIYRLVRYFTISLVSLLSQYYLIFYYC